ncbi:MAG: hypothetical protein ACOC83_06535 [Gemmatimonadota bacterium]
MTELSTSVRTVDLDGSVPKDDPVSVELPRSGELEVRSVTGSVWMRFNNRSAERRPLRGGETLCWEEGQSPIRRVLLDNGGGVGGQVVLEMRVGFTVRGFAGQQAKRQLPQPVRLSGELAEGATIDEGEHLEEDVDTSDAQESLRIRALLEGGTELEEEGTVSDASDLDGAEGLAVDEDAELAFVGHNNGIASVDVSDPANPTVADSVDDSGTIDDARDAHVEVHADRDLVLVTVVDPASLYVLSYASDGTLTVEGSVDLDGPSGLALWRDEDLAYVGRSTGGVPGTTEGVSSIDYSDETSPSIVETRTSIVQAQVVALHVGNRRLYTAYSAEDEVTVFRVTETGAMELLENVDVAQGLTADDGWSRFSGMAVDEAEDLLVLCGPAQIAGSGTDVLQVYRIQGNTLSFAGDVETGIEPDYPALDPTAQQVAYADGGNDNGLEIVSYSDPTSPQVLEAFDDSGYSGELATDGELIYATVRSDDEVAVISWDSEVATLKRRPLLTDGVEAQTGRPSDVTLHDGVEEMVDMDLDGEDRVRVRLEGLGGQSEVQYVEQYRR